MASNHPGKNEVTVPMNISQRDADVERKVQLYAMYEAFKNGKLPSNKQIDIALNSAIDSDMLKNPNKGLSEEGRLLVQDLRNTMNEAKLLLLSKNNGELLQDFIHNTTEASPSACKIQRSVWPELSL